MAKIYDVYDDFNEEMRNISHFFNLNFSYKKISNEEFIFNILEQQLAEKKIVDYVNTLKEQNKAENLKKNKKTSISMELPKAETAPKKENKIAEEMVEAKKKDVGAKKEVEDKKDAKVDEKNLDVKSGKVEVKECKVWEKEKTVEVKEEKVVAPVKIDDVKKVVEGKKNPVVDVNKIEEKVVERKMEHVINVIKDNFDKTAKDLKNKIEGSENILNLFSTSVKEKKVENVKAEEVKRVFEKVPAEHLKEKFSDVGFERRYLQNGKYVIDGVNLETSVFVKKIPKVRVEDKKCEEKIEKCEERKSFGSEEVKNKKFKINCNIDQNLLNGCYWPTQL